jgi:hypothetical protein
MTGEEIAAGEQNTEESPDERTPVVLGSFASWRRGLQNFDGLLYDRVCGRARWRTQVLLVDLSHVI